MTKEQAVETRKRFFKIKYIPIKSILPPRSLINVQNLIEATEPFLKRQLIKKKEKEKGNIYIKKKVTCLKKVEYSKMYKDCFKLMMKNIMN